MSQLKSCLYFIKFKDDTEKTTMNKVMLEASLDNIYDNVSKIVKRYRLHDGSNTLFNLTLYSEDENNSADDYITHYKSLPKEKYGNNILDDFDIEIITMFN